MSWTSFSSNYFQLFFTLPSHQISDKDSLQRQFRADIILFICYSPILSLFDIFLVKTRNLAELFEICKMVIPFQFVMSFPVQRLCILTGEKRLSVQSKAIIWSGRHLEDLSLKNCCILKLWFHYLLSVLIR